MISYFPNGFIQSKVNNCSCNSCIEGEFTSCLIEKGKNVQIVDEASYHDDDDSSENESDTAAYELRAESVNSILSRNTTNALYSASSSLELFCLSKVLVFGIADENMIDDYNHLIPKGFECIKCQYYEKQKGS